MATPREEMKQALAARLMEQFETPPERPQNEVKTYETYYTLPPGASAWFPKSLEEPTNYYFDIIPYYTGDKYPTALPYKIPPNSLTYLLEVYRHERVGPENKQVVCPRMNYGGKCPICEEMFRRYKETPKSNEAARKLITKEFQPRHRVMYNVIVRDNPEEEAKGIQIFETSHFKMENEIKTLAGKARKKIMYPDLDLGKIIGFTKVKKGDNVSIYGYCFEDRIKYNENGEEIPYVITDEQVNQAYKLDMLLKIHSYDEIKEMMGDSYSEQHQITQELPERSDPYKENVVENNVILSKNEVKDECPYGGVFSVDYDQYTECEECQVVFKCGEAKRATTNRKKTLSPRQIDDVPF